MVDIGVNNMVKNMRYAKGTRDFYHFLVFGMHMAM